MVLPQLHFILVASAARSILEQVTYTCISSTTDDACTSAAVPETAV